MKKEDLEAITRHFLPSLVRLQERVKKLEENTHEKNKRKHLIKIMKRRNHIGNSEELSEEEAILRFNRLLDTDRINILLELI